MAERSVALAEERALLNPGIASIVGAAAQARGLLDDDLDALRAAVAAFDAGPLASRWPPRRRMRPWRSCVVQAATTRPSRCSATRSSSLRPVLDGLATWGFAHVPVPDGAESRASWVVFAMTAARPGGPQPPDALVELSIDEELFWVRSTAGQTNASLGPSPLPPELRMRTNQATFAELACGRMSPAAAVRTGSLAVDGPRATATAFFKAFRIPT